MNFPNEIDGWLTEEEGTALADLAAGRVVLEIGSYCGRSTVCLAQAAERVHAVDTFDGRATPKPESTLEIFKANLSRHGVADKVTIHVGRSAEAILPAGSCDLAFIDGAHDFASVIADIAIALRSLKPGGVLAFHDYREYPGEYDGRWDEGVTNAVASLLQGGAKLLARRGSIAIVKPCRAAAVHSEEHQPHVALCMARRGREIADDGAAEGFYRFPARHAVIAALIKPVSTVLPQSFNEGWAGALDLRDSGVPLEIYGQIHDDVTPPPWWVDTLIGELRKFGADVCSAVIPIKTEKGLTSTAIYRGDLWLPQRLTMTEVMELPETFTAEDVGGPILPNTGLWVADITKPWVDSICFDFMTRIRRTADGKRVAEFVPEDWLFGSQCMEAGAKVIATRKVTVNHSGISDYPNDRAWGSWKTDELYRQRNAKKEMDLCGSSS